MKILLGTAALGIALLSFAGSNDSKVTTSCDPSTLTIYQDTVPRRDTNPRRDTSNKNRKNQKDRKERRDTMYLR